MQTNKNGVNRLDSYESATLIIDLVQFSGNEDMFIAFLDKFECKFDFCTLDENTTILHVCETNNFSDSTLLRRGQRESSCLTLKTWMK